MIKLLKKFEIQIIFAVFVLLFGGLAGLLYYDYIEDKKRDIAYFKKNGVAALNLIKKCQNPAVTYYDDKFRYDTTVTCKTKDGRSFFVHEIFYQGDRSIQVVLFGSDGRKVRLFDDISLGYALKSKENAEAYRELIKNKQRIFYEANAPQSKLRDKELLKSVYINEYEK